MAATVENQATDSKAALAQSMYSGSVGRKQPLLGENDLQELLKPLSK